MTETQSWSTDEVVRLAGVSSRTLRHYDQVGLLRPAGTGPGGRRFYRRVELRRLQHVLVLRELGLGLPDIAAVLDPAPVRHGGSPTGSTPTPTG